MKKLSQIALKIFILLIVFQISFIPVCHATGFWGELFGTGSNFIEEGRNQGSAIEDDDMKEQLNMIYNLLLALGIVIAVLIGAILGIKFMFGSLEEQAKIKETLIPYIIGCIIVFGAFGIWKFAVTIMNNVTEQASQTINIEGEPSLLGREKIEHLI